MLILAVVPYLGYEVASVAPFRCARQSRVRGRNEKKNKDILLYSVAPL